MQKIGEFVENTWKVFHKLGLLIEAIEISSARYRIPYLARYQMNAHYIPMAIGKVPVLTFQLSTFENEKLLDRAPPGHGYPAVSN
ncbi:unnamed protein product [Lasius platythorax]|uniref:Uncharacterized protein n=1 Tax=Lasius platythorax TaxID=488582 RepID=A0AAV2NU31_9HYME